MTPIGARIAQDQAHRRVSVRHAVAFVLALVLLLLPTGASLAGVPPTAEFVAGPGVLDYEVRVTTGPTAHSGASTTLCEDAFSDELCGLYVECIIERAVQFVQSLLEPRLYGRPGVLEN